MTILGELADHSVIIHGCLSYLYIARIRHFEESLNVKSIWIEVLRKGSTLSFQNQWPRRCEYIFFYKTP